MTTDAPKTDAPKTSAPKTVAKETGASKIEFAVRAVLLGSVLLGLGSFRLSPLAAQISTRGGGFAALVNGKPITFFELEQSVDRRMLALRGRNPDSLLEGQRPRVRSDVLSELITERLLLGRCDGLKIEVRTDEVDQWVQMQIDDARSRGDDSIGDVSDFFDQWEADFGENEEQARHQIRNRLRIRQLLNSIYLPEYISPAELRAYYRNHPKEFSTPTVHEFRQIVLPMNDPDRLAVLAAIDADRVAGKPFVEIIREHSRGPRTNIKDAEGEWVTTDEELDSFYSPVPETVRATPVGMVTEPLYAGQMIHIIEVMRHTPGRQKGFDECQLDIRSKLRYMREDQQRQRFERELHRNAEIRQFLTDSPRG